MNRRLSAFSAIGICSIAADVPFFFLDLRTGEERARGKSSCSLFVHQFLKGKFAGTGRMTSGWGWLRPLLLTPPNAASPPRDISLLIVFIWLLNLSSEVEGEACELLRPSSKLLKWLQLGFCRAIEKEEDVYLSHSGENVRVSILLFLLLQGLYCPFFGLFCNLKQMTFDAAWNVFSGSRLFDRRAHWREMRICWLYLIWNNRTRYCTTLIEFPQSF